MRPSLIAACLLAASVLVACQTQLPKGTPLATDEISVTSLDAPDASAADREKEAAPVEGEPLRPEPRPETPADAAEADPAAAEPDASEASEAPKSPEQVLCQRTGGQWAVAGLSGAYVCVKSTRDGGKLCRKKTDCEGLCLARSKTCAPIMPIFGCNDVLEKDGRQVTLCIN